MDANLIQNKNTTVYLLGYMAVGKTTVGKKLATKLGYAFVDLDHLIEAQTGLSVATIFEQKGEAFFRTIESEVLQTTNQLKNTVISCGGGTPCFNNNLDWLLNNGKVIYLYLATPILLSRLWQHKQTRPLIANMTKEQMETFVINHLSERKPFYEKAHHHYNTMIDDIELLIKKLN